MTMQEIHTRLTTLAQELDDIHSLICEGHPENAEGFPQLPPGELRDALNTIDMAASCLHRVAFKIARENADELDGDDD